MKAWCLTIFLFLWMEIRSQGRDLSCIICPERLVLSNMFNSGKAFLSAYQHMCVPRESKSSAACFVSVEINYNRRVVYTDLTDENPFEVETELDGLFVHTELYWSRVDDTFITKLVYKCSTPLFRCNYLLFDYINRKRLLDGIISERYDPDWIDRIHSYLTFDRSPGLQECWVTGNDEPQLCEDKENSCAFERSSHQQCRSGSDPIMTIETAITTSNERSEWISFGCIEAECNSFESLRTINQTVRLSYETKTLIWPVNFTEERPSTTSTFPISK